MWPLSLRRTRQSVRFRPHESGYWSEWRCGTPWAASVNMAFVSAAEYLLSQMGRPPSVRAAGAQVWRRVASLCMHSSLFHFHPVALHRHKPCSRFPHRPHFRLLHFAPKKANEFSITLHYFWGGGVQIIWNKPALSQCGSEEVFCMWHQGKKAHVILYMITPSPHNLTRVTDYTDKHNISIFISLFVFLPQLLSLSVAENLSVTWIWHAQQGFCVNLQLQPAEE